MTIPADLDARIMRRCAPYIEQSIADPEQPAYLRWWAAGGMPGLSISFPEPERIAFHAGGPAEPVFCSMDSRLAGIWRGDGAAWYTPCPLLDDDMDGDPVELTPAG